MLTQSYNQKLKDLIYILGEKGLNALAREDYEMVYAAGAAKRYVKSAMGDLKTHRTIMVTTGTRYLNYKRPSLG